MPNQGNGTGHDLTYKNRHSKDSLVQIHIKKMLHIRMRQHLLIVS